MMRKQFEDWMKSGTKEDRQFKNYLVTGGANDSLCTVGALGVGLDE